MSEFLQPNFPVVSPSIQAIRRLQQMREQEVVAELLGSIAPLDEARVVMQASGLVEAIRREQRGKGGVDALLKEFSLSTEEGIVLMCLAEALLRVPDNDTADDLIRDKLMSGNWSSHLGRSDSLFVNASAWGLLMTGKVTRLTAAEQSKRLNMVQKTLGRLGEPVIRTAMKAAMEIMGTQFVLGTTITQATQRAKKREANGYCYSFDMLGEGARTEDDAVRYLASYRNAIEVIGKNQNPDQVPGISVKLSALHPRYEPHRDLSLLIERTLELAALARSYDIGFTIDAEEASRLEVSLGVIETVFTAPDLTGWNGFGIAVQAYQKRAPAVLDWAIDLAKRAKRQMNIRLVKGAYWDSEIKWAQQEGLFDYPVFTRKPSTDLCYRVCAEKLLSARPHVFPQFATHNAQTVATICALDDQAKGDRKGFEFQRLHGMGDSLYDALLKQEPVQCRIYAPVGEHAELLAYLVRRLLENGANSSFVNNIIDETIAVERLTEDPVELVRELDDVRSSYIPLPADLYRMSGREPGLRANARGLDLSDDAVLADLKREMEHYWQSRPITSGRVKVHNPATGELIGQLDFAAASSMLQTVDELTSASEWSSRTPVERAAVLHRLADLIERDMPILLSLCIREAGKTLADSVAEVREAVDFCRYYADREEAMPAHYEPLGLVLCISPWNFPVAIFIGQIVAALVAGNRVIGKPAEQTSLVAQHISTLILEAGIPANAYRLLVAEGEVVGANLIPHPALDAVMFTGSDGVARSINRTLAKPMPLIAETGGQNAMIVDSTALFEQVVDDVILSGFNSAGQRCSALRLLYLQSDVADRIIRMIEGAMSALKIGDPNWLDTDVGPVIDNDALQQLQSHVDKLSGNPRARLIYQQSMPEDLPAAGHFFPPTLFEIEHPELLEREVFGPIVHIVRFKRSDLDQVLKDINGAGFGLTFGIHSRIAEASARATARIEAGNVYVNRNMVGAIVGVQPFGGRGKSGTGPKAGGPNYLYRLVRGEAAAPEPARGFTPDVAATSHFSSDLAEAAFANWSATAFSDREANIWPQLNMLPDAVARNCISHCEIAKQFLSQKHPLPGPTGEDDHLRYESKGLVCILPLEDVSLWWSRVIAVLMTGNIPVLVDADDRRHELFAGLADQVFHAGSDQLKSLLQLPALRAVLGFAGASSSWYREQLAGRPGAIVPYLTEADPDQLIRLLLHEKVVSIDTTAAGGNATLLNAAGRDEGLAPVHGATL